MDIEYKIKTSAELAGAEAAADSLERQIGKAKALKQDYSELDAQLKTMRGSIDEAKESLTANTDKMEEAGTAATHSAGKHSAFRRILGELDRISPGLGHSLHLVSEAYIEAGVSAEGGAVGVDGFTTALEELLVTLGPLIIAMLGIQAAIEYWDLYKEKVKAAEEATTESLKKVVESYGEVRKAIDEVEKARHAGDRSVQQQIEDAAKIREEAAAAKAAGNREVLKIQEEQALAGATTPEDKARVRKHFADVGQRYQGFEDEIKQGNIGSEIGDASSARDQQQLKADAIQAQIISMGVNGDPGERAKLAGEMSEVAKTIAGLNELISSLQRKEAGEETVSRIKKQNAASAEGQRVQGDNTVAEGVSALAANATGDHSKKTADAINALRSSYTMINGNIDNLLAAIKFAHDHGLNQQQEIELIKRQLQYLAQKSAQHDTSIDQR